MFEFLSKEDKEEKLLQSLLKTNYTLNNHNIDSFVGSNQDHISNITKSGRAFLNQI